MKKTLAILIFLLFTQVIDAQVIITDSIKLKIKHEVEMESIDFKQTLSKEKDDKSLNQFMLDTFKIERTMAKTMDIDYSTHGMLNAMYDAADSYDKLMNIYYQLLMKNLKPADKIVLTNAQKAWLKYRDAEKELIIKVNGDDYTGGGTMYQLQMNSLFLDRIQKRAIELFMFYNDIVIKN